MSNCCNPQDLLAGWDWIPTTPPKGSPCDTSAGFEEQDWVADWQFNERGAFMGANSLHSAVIMQLFTDRRLPNDQDGRVNDPFERGGWWGDYFAPFQMGSHLWVLYREKLTENTLPLVRRYVREALQPLIDQGAAVRLEIYVEKDSQRGHLVIIPTLYAQDGAKIYEQQFSRVWE